MTRKINFVHLTAVSVLSVLVALGMKVVFGSDWYEFAAVVTGVVAVYLVTVEHIINWPVGLANVSLYAWVFYQSHLYADVSLQFFFFALGVHGWYQWAHGGSDKTELKMSRLKTSQWGLVAAAWLVGTAIYVPIITYLKGAAPFSDSFLTVGSIIAQVLLNRKKLENWIIWIAVDIAYIPLFISRGLFSTAVLYFLLLCLAVSGLLSWRKTHLANNLQ